MEAVKPRFPTILIARSNDARPSDLEFQLRHHCQKLRVVEKLSGAHVLFPGESSLAIRAYDEEAIREMEQQWPPNADGWKQWQQYLPPKNHHHIGNTGEGDGAHTVDHDNFDDLRAFRNAFQMTVVLFIIPHNKQRMYIDNTTSLFHRAQRVMSYSPLHDSVKAFENKVTRVMLVPSTQKAISTLMSTAEAMKKREARQVYFNKQREKYFLPDSRKGAVGAISTSPSTSAAAAKHVADAFRQWALRFDLPPGEADVMMSLLGSLGDIVTADDNVLEEIPMEDRSKRMLHAFFGSHGTIETKKVPDMITTMPSFEPPPTTMTSGRMAPSDGIYMDQREPPLRWTPRGSQPPIGSALHRQPVDPQLHHHHDGIAVAPPLPSANPYAPTTFVTPTPRTKHQSPHVSNPYATSYSRQMPVASSSSRKRAPSSSFRSLPAPAGSTMHPQAPQPHYPPNYKNNTSSMPFRPMSRFT